MPPCGKVEVQLQGGVPQRHQTLPIFPADAWKWLHRINTAFEPSFPSGTGVVGFPFDRSALSEIPCYARRRFVRGCYMRGRRWRVGSRPPPSGKRPRQR
jgi:hypothetical protein